MGVPDAEKHNLLTKECIQAENIWRSIVRESELTAQVLSPDESPIKPWIIDQAEVVLIYTLEKKSLFYGSTRGHGIVIARLPSTHRTLVKWSSPLFISISSSSFGFSFGKQTTATFAVATSRTARKAFSSPTCHSMRGFEFNFACGTGLQDRSNVVSVNFSEDLGIIGISKVNGVAIDFGFVAKGGFIVDQAKCKAAYGDVSPAQILSQQGPSEFQPLYGELSRVVASVEHPSSNPARTSASLERFSSGRDPERVMVLPDGVVIRDDLKEPPRE